MQYTNKKPTGSLFIMTLSNIKFSSILAVFFLLWGCQPEEKKLEYTMSSPDERITINLSYANSSLTYTVQNKDQLIVSSSRLGIIRNDANLSTNLKYLSSEETVNITQSYQLLTGKESEIEEKGKVYKHTFSNFNGDLLQIEFQLYNSGFAFKYIFPEKTGDKVRVLNDETTISFSGQGKAWMQPYGDVNKWGPAYENTYQVEDKLYRKSPTKYGWCMPALFQVNNNYILFTDAGIEGNYAGIHLDADSAANSYKMRWPEPGEAQGLYDVHPTGELPWETSWKVFAIGDLNTIITNNIVTHVNKESVVKNSSWIIPGASSWSWLSDIESPKNYESLKDFVDLSADMDWKYSLVDANWDLMKGGTIEDLVSYAKEKNVELLIWYNSGGPHNTVSERPRDIMNNREARRKEFAKLNEWGVKGVKIDFFQSDKQELMKLYEDILIDASEYEILVNFHGSTFPKGWKRTYPHLMTMEAVKGEESYAFSESYPKFTLRNNTILPYTRNVVGSMDYTPVMFNDLKFKRLTTAAHELALSVVFESGLIHFGGSIESYRSAPDFVQNFIANVPVSWDETKYLEGTPGEDIIIARKRDNEWYIAGINGDSTARTYNLNLSFLDESASLEFISDGDSRDQMVMSNRTDFSNVTVAPYGGFVAKTVKQ